MMPRKEDEIGLFISKSSEELFEIYCPMCSLLLEKVEPRSTLTFEIILNDLENELRKAIYLYKENKRYFQDQHFSSYYFYFFKKYVNNQIDRGLLRIKDFCDK